MLVLSNLAELTEDHLRQVADVDPRIEVVRETDASSFHRLIGRAEVLYGTWFSRADLAHAGSLRWVQLNTAGVDHMASSGLLDGRLAVTTVKGIHRVPMAEYVLCVMLMWVRNMPALMRAQAERRWAAVRSEDVYSARELAGQTLGIVSLGEIGDEVARRAKAFGMRVVGTRRTVTAELISQKPPHVDELIPAARLIDLASQSDFVLLSLPLTGETRGLVDEPKLRAMKRGSFLINISRGAIIDEDALLRALREGWIGGAALDAFVKEPLPADHPFYGLPNVVLTPHVSGESIRYFDRSVELFCRNLRRYLDGQPLMNLVDTELGY